MHYSAQLDLEVALRRHILPNPRRTKKPGLSVLIVGDAADTSLAEMISRFGLTPTMASVRPATTSTRSRKAGSKLPYGDSSFDAVLSVDSLQHDPFFTQTFADMCRVCRDKGIIVVSAPSADTSSGHSTDFWRFLTGSMQALADSSGVRLIDSWRSELGPSHNEIGVFCRSRSKSAGTVADTPSLADLGLTPVLQNEYPAHEFPEREMIQGVENYRRLLGRMHHELSPRFYLEIGVESGRTLAAATGRAVGIDPAPVLQVKMPRNCKIALETSDDYFNARRHDGSIPPIDYAFIDGMHVFENVLMDFMNVERHASPTSVIVVDDVLPNHPVQAYRKRETQHWTGDVWKIVPTLREQRPDLLLLHINTAPTGLLFVIGADAGNRTLWNNFDLVISRALDEIGDPTEEFTHRHDAIDPNDPLLNRIFRYLRTTRDGNLAPDIDYLKELVEGARPRVIAEQV